VRSMNRLHSLGPDRKVSEAVSRREVAYIPPKALASQLAMRGLSPMAVMTFGHTLSERFTCPAIAVDLPQIQKPPLVEVWMSDRPVQTLETGDGSFAMNGDHLIGSIQVQESPRSSLDFATYVGYQKLIHQLRDLGYPYLWRTWNYFPQINGNQNGLERYRRFCLGRHQALTETLHDFPASLPAGTAVGTKSGPLEIVCLAGTQPAMHIGNPRQVNAYEYPAEYGPRSPSFARATFTRSEQGNLLLIAGTASIVGHASCHVGLPKEQMREAIRNVQALLAHAEQVTGSDLAAVQQRASYKVYVRHPDMLPDIRSALEESPISGHRIVFLTGDLCRTELLVEIEGLIISE